MNPLSSEHMAAPGLVVYWFGSDLFYANLDRFAGQAHKLVTDSQSPVTWLVVDAGAITSIDYTAGGGLKELAKEFYKRGLLWCLPISTRTSERIWNAKS
jgi:sulfate permease, SulP family